MLPWNRGNEVREGKANVPMTGRPSLSMYRYSSYKRAVLKFLTS